MTRLRQARARRAKLLVSIATRIPPPLLYQPWGAFIKVACIFSGVSYFLDSTPRTITMLLPAPIVLLWYTCLVFGGAVGLVGLLRSRWRLEVAGLLPLGTASLVYGVTIFMFAGTRGLTAGLMICAFGLAAHLRALGVYTALFVARLRVSGAR